MFSQKVSVFLEEWYNTSDRVLVKTSGSTGAPKPLWVEKRRMEASARITCDFLGLLPGDTALLCMPLDFIAGKMMVVRAIERKLRLICIAPTGHPMGVEQGMMYDFTSTPFASYPVSLPTEITFAAMVPLQVYNSLQEQQECQQLMKIRQLIIGGGAIDDLLAETLKSFPHAVWSTYGMTETLSHIALRRLSGIEASEWYTPFDGVHLSLNTDQCLVIDAPHVCEQPLVTNDIAELLDDGSMRFRIIGRKDNVICSGGVKIQIEEVEKALHPHLSVPFVISKRKDPKFGEVPVLLYESAEEQSFADPISSLPRYWQPQYCLRVDHIPMTETGKPARKEVECIVAHHVPLAKPIS